MKTRFHSVVTYCFLPFLHKLTFFTFANFLAHFFWYLQYNNSIEDSAFPLYIFMYALRRDELPSIPPLSTTYNAEYPLRSSA